MANIKGPRQLSRIESSMTLVSKHVSYQLNPILNEESTQYSY